MLFQILQEDIEVTESDTELDNTTSCQERGTIIGIGKIQLYDACNKKGCHLSKLKDGKCPNCSTISQNQVLAIIVMVNIKTN